MRFVHLWKNISKKYSLLRAYQNETASNIILHGDGIDLGAKSKDAKYYQYLNLSNVNNIVFIDYFSKDKSMVDINLEEKFSIPDNSYDFILSFNILEHIYNSQLFIQESYRVLKHQGEMHIMVPFLWRYHADPYDYFRFTHEALEKLMMDNGFKDIKISVTGSGPFKVMSSMIANFIRFQPLVFLIHLISIKIDDIYLMKSRNKHTYPLGYYCTAKRL